MIRVGLPRLLEAAEAAGVDVSAGVVDGFAATQRRATAANAMKRRL
jgi:hypothetical protein